MTSHQQQLHHHDDITGFHQPRSIDDQHHGDIAPIDKAEIEHYDAEHMHGKGDEVADAWSKGQVATGYESVSIPQTIVKFKMACLVCFLATFAAATDGYQSELVVPLIKKMS